jgi:hypothetical protein
MESPRELSMNNPNTTDARDTFVSDFTFLFQQSR